MTETTARILWNDGDEITGSTGVLGPLTFRIIRVYMEAKWMLLAHGLGMDSRQARNDDREELKAEAERWLEEFVSSLGAVFADPVADYIAAEQLRIEDEDKSR